MVAPPPPPTKPVRNSHKHCMHKISSVLPQMLKVVCHRVWAVGCVMSNSGAIFFGWSLSRGKKQMCYISFWSLWSVNELLNGQLHLERWKVVQFTMCSFNRFLDILGWYNTLLYMQIIYLSYSIYHMCCTVLYHSIPGMAYFVPLICFHN